MNSRKPGFLIVIYFILVTFMVGSGCISHRFFINLSTGDPLKYTVDGDSLDMFDGKLKMPPGEPWIEASRERNLDEDSTVTLSYTYNSPLGKPGGHPLSPPESEGYFIVKRANYLLAKYEYVEALFPGWQTSENYGDLEEFVPQEVSELHQPGADTLLPESRVEKLQNMEALGLQKGTARRYMYQMRDMLGAWDRLKGGEETDSTMIQEGLQRFSPLLQAHLLTLRDEEPVEVSLEWYPELRSSMISVAREVTFDTTETLSLIADSIDHRWKSWLDLEDDRVELMVISEAKWKKAYPDTTRSDTLEWVIRGSELKEGDIIIKYAGWTPVIWADTLAVLIVVVLIALIARGRKSAA